MLPVRRLSYLHFVLLPLFLLLPSMSASASDTLFGGHNTAPPAKHGPPPDMIVFSNGDRLSGTFVREVGGTVTFHSDIVGDINVPWSKIKELDTKSRMAVLTGSITPQYGKAPARIPQGSLSVADNMITVTPENNATIPPIPVKSAQYIIDETTLSREILGHPGVFGGWRGSMTAGATIVQATQKQYTFNGGIALARVEPSVTWLNPKNRTTIDFTGSYGKITQRAYVSEGVFYPASNSKSSIFHAAAEQDKYFSTRFYALAQTTFDHNYSQGLNLQQVYGAGIGYTAFKWPKQELDFKVTGQYEKQNFIDASDGINQNLIGSTVAGAYVLHLFRGLLFNQQVSYLPAYNNTRAYSASETNSLAIPFYKSLSFQVGTMDSYLNDPPPAVPPTLRNSFQFTFGANYSFKSKY
ncbi:MAG: DUF481 domain-containing protein [Acidobacteriaceae bacterium]